MRLVKVAEYQHHGIVHCHTIIRLGALTMANSTRLPGKPPSYSARPSPATTRGPYFAVLSWC